MSMKTLTIAVAMMGLGLGAASAQMQPQTSQQTPQRGQSMEYCLKGASGTQSCTYPTMASCEQAKTGQSDSCMKNPASTTGSGGAMKPGDPMRPGSGAGTGGMSR